MKSIPVIEVISAGLKATGYDGLVLSGVCGCLADDLAPGGCLCDRCEAGYKHAHSARPDDWIVSTERDGVTDADIERVIAECG